MHHSRLFRASVTHVGFSACGTYLAAAAASTDRVALLKVTGAGQQVQLLGYVKAEGESSLAQPTALSAIHLQADADCSDVRMGTRVAAGMLLFISLA